MNIIHKGQLPQDKVYQSACIHCGTIFEFERHEATAHNDRNETVLLIKCPVCKKSLTTNI